MITNSTVLNIRISAEELVLWEQEAKEAHIGVAEYVRRSARMKPLRSVLSKPQIGMVIGTPDWQYSLLHTWSEAPQRGEAHG